MNDDSIFLCMFMPISMEASCMFMSMSMKHSCWQSYDHLVAQQCSVTVKGFLCEKLVAYDRLLHQENEVAGHWWVGRFYHIVVAGTGALVAGKNNVQV